MNKLNLLFVSALLGLTISCGNKTKENLPSVPNDSTKKSTVDTVKVSSWNGVYTDEFGGTLTISNFNASSSFDFKIDIVTNTQSDDICTGEVSGKAVLGKPNNASFDLKEKDTECHLTFIFDGKSSIEVGEADCISMHGGQCGFEGTYKK